MSQDLADRFGLGPIDQVGFVVADIEGALDRYRALFGEFDVYETPLSGCTIRGREADCKLKLAVNRSGPVEIELIEVLEGETPHSEHLRAHGEGLHHVRFRVTSLEEKLESLRGEGLEPIFYKRFGPTVAFAYLEAPASFGTTVVELLEMP